MYISSIAKSRSNAFIEPTSTTQWVLSSTNPYYAMSVKFNQPVLRNECKVQPTSITQWVLSSTNQYYAMSVKFKETTGAFDLVRIHSDTLLTAPL